MRDSRKEGCASVFEYDKGKRDADNKRDMKLIYYHLYKICKEENYTADQMNQMKNIADQWSGEDAAAAAKEEAAARERRSRSTRRRSLLRRGPPFFDYLLRSRVRGFRVLSMASLLPREFANEAQRHGAHVAHDVLGVAQLHWRPRWRQR